MVTRSQGGNGRVVVEGLERRRMLAAAGWSSYLGGSDTDVVNAVAVDGAGNVFVAGYTRSAGWARGGFDTSYGEGNDGFVARINADGTLAWSSYIGGSNHDIVNGLAVDAAGNVYVAGETYSTGWASGGYDEAYGGSYDGFVAKVNADGTLAWASYLGGSGEDQAKAVAVDIAGNVYVTGYTGSSGWVSGGSNTTFRGSTDAFVVKLDSDGVLGWSSYAGGSSSDYGYAIAVDGDGNVYFGGDTTSSGWVSGGFDVAYSYYDGFIAKIGADGTPLWSSYMGGGNDDHTRALAVDASGDVYVAGHTDSYGWASGGFDTTHNGGLDGYVARIRSNGTLDWSSYLGGSSYDYVNAVTVDSSGDVYAAGYAYSPGWASGGFGSTIVGGYDGFVVKLGGDGSWTMNGRLGGTGTDSITAMTSDSGGNVYVAGMTASAGWISGGFDTTQNGSDDGFVAKLVTAEVTGTPMVDDITVGMQGSQVAVKVNGVTTLYDRTLTVQITINAFGGNDAVIVGAEVGLGLVVYGGEGNDWIAGGSGNDRFEGGNGNDTIVGGGGNDTVYGHDGADSMEGGAGNDELYGNGGRDTLYGGDGDDVVFGQGFDDVLYGNFGNDTMDGGDGHDSMMGGLGADSMLGGLGEDSIYGGDQSDTIYGQEGNDYIEGKGKADTVYGGSGNDTIWGGAGADLIMAEDGDDWIGTADGVFVDSVYGGSGQDVLEQDAGDLLEGVEEGVVR